MQFVVTWIVAIVICCNLSLNLHHIQKKQCQLGSCRQQIGKTNHSSIFRAWMEKTCNCSRTCRQTPYHKQTHCVLPKILCGGFPRLFLIQFFSTFVSTLFTIPFNESSPYIPLSSVVILLHINSLMSHVAAPMFNS